MPPQMRGKLSPSAWSAPLTTRQAMPFSWSTPPSALAGVGVADADLGRVDILRARHILRRRQLLQPEIAGDAAEQVELPRRVVDFGLVVADDDRIALAAAQHRPGEVVDIGVVVPVAQLPVERPIFDVGVKPLAVAESPRTATR